MLASAGDDGTVMLWHLTDRPVTSFGESASDEADTAYEKEHWRMTRMIRVSSQEIYDIAWSPNGDSLAVGGTDFVARIINPHDGTVLKELSDHTHYVQGVAWDPLNEYLATQSSDRSVHVHSLQTKMATQAQAAASSSSTANSGYVPPVTRNSKLDLHRRTGSGTMAWTAEHAHTKPALRRGSTHVSQIESDTEGEATALATEGASGSKRREGSFTAVRGRSARSHTPMEPPSTVPHLPNHPPTIARGATPTPASSVPQSPAFSTASASASVHPMNPPQKTPSRRSSFSGSQAEVATSPPTSIASFPAATVGNSSAASIYKAAVHGSGGGNGNADGAVTTNSSSSRARRSASRPGSIRSPSPAPLPAIRPPPSPRQRLQAAQMLGSSHASAPTGSLLQAGMRMYGDEAFSGFFRRLSFSPDGALLVTPSGIFDAQSPSSPVAPTSAYSHSPSKSLSAPPSGISHHSLGPRGTVYLYGRANLTRCNAPIAHLPGHKTATLVVRFSPILYELRKTHSSAFSKAEDGAGIAPHPNIPLEAGKQKGVSLNLISAQEADEAKDATVVSLAAAASARSETLASPSSGATSLSSPSKGSLPPLPPISMIGLPYRMVFAVATHDVVWIYDTQQGGPLCCFSNMHYASFTDLSWSADGQTLIMSSSDGYCSVAVFDYGELGTPYTYAQQPSLSQSAMATLPASGVHPTSAAGNVVTLSTKKKAAPAPAPDAKPTKLPPTPSTPTPSVAAGTPRANAAAVAPSSSPPSSSPAPSSKAQRTVLTTAAVIESAATASEAAQEESAADATPKSTESLPKTKKRRIQPTLHQQWTGAKDSRDDANASTGEGDGCS